MKKIWLSLALLPALQAQSPAPWQPRPVIIVDPRPYLSSPSPQPKPHAKPRAKPHATQHARSAPAQRSPAAGAAPETFERLDTSPSPTPPPRPK
jgi:hypothetical protein